MRFLDLPTMSSHRALSRARQPGMAVFTDVSYTNGMDSFAIGLVVRGERGTCAFALEHPIIPGENPEDTAVGLATRLFPGAFGYYTDYRQSSLGTYRFRKHPGIDLCHDLARAKMRSLPASELRFSRHGALLTATK